MVFSWLFGEKKRPESGGAEVAGLLERAERATTERDAERGEALCREAIAAAQEDADAWTLLGVNLIRRGAADPENRAEAVVAWMRALALRPGDARAADHLQTELQFPDDLLDPLVRRLPTPSGNDAAGALVQLGSRARPAIEAAARQGGLAAERARSLLASMS